MSSPFKHQRFEAPNRVSQSLRNDRCQNILCKAVFEHFIEIKTIAALLLASKSFQNSTFGANFIINFVVELDSIGLINAVLAPSSCFSIQFVPSLYIRQPASDFEGDTRHISDFVGELVKTKYLHSSLRSLTIDSAPKRDLSRFTSNAWPQLQELTLVNFILNDDELESIAKNALQLRALRLSENSGITDAGLEIISKISGITSLALSYCRTVTDAGLKHLSKLPSITVLDLSSCEDVTDAGFDYVSKLANITSLDLSCCNNFTDACVEHICNLASITVLNLSCCNKITDVGLELVSTLSKITSLNLFNCRSITDAGLEFVSHLSGLTSLNLSYCNLITGAGLEYLANVSSLRSLEFWYCDKITFGAKKKIKAALPKCKIEG